MTGLRECPFCGCDSADYMPDRLMAPGADPPVFCNECHASAMDAAAWNRRADDWQPIETAPQDRRVMVWASPRDNLPGFVTIAQWSEWGGWCVDELRHTTHWRPLPEGPR